MGACGIWGFRPAAAGVSVSTRRFKTRLRRSTRSPERKTPPKRGLLRQLSQQCHDLGVGRFAWWSCRTPAFEEVAPFARISSESWFISSVAEAMRVSESEPISRWLPSAAFLLP